MRRYLTRLIKSLISINTLFISIASYVVLYCTILILSDTLSFKALNFKESVKEKKSKAKTRL